MIQSRASKLSRTAFNVLRRHGLFFFIKHAFLHLVENGFTRKVYYIYENDFSHIPEFTPKIENYVLRVISKPSEVDEMLAHGYDFKSYRNFYRDVPELKQTLAKGAIAFAAFVGKELAHTTWVALNEQAKQDIDSVNYKVDFLGGEVCSGDSETKPKYRQLGIHASVYTKILQFLKQEGYSKDRLSVEKRNIISHHSHVKVNFKVCTQMTVTTILWWSFCMEKPMNV
ncbi:hypothetical protein ACFLYG_00215 [Chloroflexota bacterium]